MSNMNTLQSPKPFDRFQGHDHGTRGNTFVNHNEYGKEKQRNAIAATAKVDFRENMDDYLDTLSPAQLEAEATAILGENETSGDVLFTTSSDVSESTDPDEYEDELYPGEADGRWDSHLDDLADEQISREQAEIRMSLARRRAALMQAATLDHDATMDDDGDFTDAMHGMHIITK